MISSIHRPTVVTVSLENIRFNLEQVMSRLPEETEAWAVVKANAYGHGSIAVAKALENQVAGFCLSNLDEALELRRAGIIKPLLVLGVVPPSSVNLALEEKIQLTVTSQAWLADLLTLDLDLSKLSFHIKLDTGMGRLGFQESEELHATLEQLVPKGANFEGIFTHFARADEADESSFKEQLRLFTAFLDRLPYTPKRIHTANSATAIWHREASFSAVRLGDVLYGLNPSGHALNLPYPIRPALSLTSHLVQVKQVAVGQTIGYGGTYKAENQEWIGTVPVGYADGLTRGMQGFQVLVDGQVCEIVGRVSMDQITIRLPKAYPLGSRVTLIGCDGSSEISVQDWADHLATINYEVVCLLSDRIPRIYENRPKEIKE